MDKSKENFLTQYRLDIDESVLTYCRRQDCMRMRQDAQIKPLVTYFHNALAMIITLLIKYFILVKDSYLSPLVSIVKVLASQGRPNGMMIVPL